MIRSQDIQFFIFKRFSTNVPLLYPVKHQKTSVFLMFSGGIEVKHCLKMGYPANIRLDEEVLKTSFAFVFRRRLQDVLIKTSIFVLVICLQDVFKTFSRRLQDVLPRCLQDVFKTSSRHLQDVLKTSSRRLQNVFKTSSRRLQDVFKTFSRRFQDVFKTFSRHFQDVLQKRLQDIFKTSSRRLQNVFKTSSRRLAKTSSRHLQDVSSS